MDCYTHWETLQHVISKLHYHTYHPISLATLPYVERGLPTRDYHLRDLIPTLAGVISQSRD